ncbi:MAG: ribonuclease HII [Pseudomonadota bacterium]
MTQPSLVCGVDEAGRGPLAGPVVAAAVILDPARPVAGIDDSKALSASRREALADQIVSCAHAYHIASASHSEIDALNILNATFLAMQRAVAGLSVGPTDVRVDGNRSPVFERNGVPLRTQCLVGGDASDVAIGAASILAKVWRDRTMHNLDAHYPQYGFARHKGYPTPAHLAALREHGPCPEHRRSFRPVRRALAERG